MTFTTTLDQLADNLTSQQQQDLQQGNVVLSGAEGSYVVMSLVEASRDQVWDLLTSYERFPEFLSSVVSSRILEKDENRVLIERKDRRKIGWLPIKVKIITENIETPRDRIDYRMIKGTLDEMQGAWRLDTIEGDGGRASVLLIHEISAKANMGPLQPYFYEVFEKGLKETMIDLRAAIERQ